MARSRKVQLSTFHKLRPYLDCPKAKVHGFLRPLINGKPKQQLEVLAMAHQCALDVPLDVEMHGLPLEDLNELKVYEFTLEIDPALL